MHVEFTFFDWLTLYFWAPRSTVESSTPPRPVSANHWRTCKVSTLYLEKCPNACRIFMFFERLSLYFWAPRGTVESSTPPRPIPESHWRTCKVSNLYLEKCPNACRIFMFFERLTLYFWAPRGTVESSTPPRPAPESHWLTCKVLTLYLENCPNALRQTDRDRDRQRRSSL